MPLDFPYTITHNKQSGIIHLVYTGCISLQDKLAAIDELIEQFSKIGFLKVLVDVRGAVVRLSEVELEAFGKYLASLKEFSNAKTAVLHSGNLDSTFLVKTITFNHWLMIAQFTDVNKAILWLSE